MQSALRACRTSSRWCSSRDTESGAAASEVCVGDVGRAGPWLKVASFRWSRSASRRCLCVSERWSSRGRIVGRSHGRPRIGLKSHGIPFGNGNVIGPRSRRGSRIAGCRPDGRRTCSGRRADEGPPSPWDVPVPNRTWPLRSIRLPLPRAGGAHGLPARDLWFGSNPGGGGEL